VASTISALRHESEGEKKIDGKHSWF